MMRLYEFGPTRSIRVRWTLQELDVPFEAVTVDMKNKEHESPEFLKINPSGRVPALVDGDVVLAESAAIALYLAEKYASRGFYPEKLEDRAQLYKWIFFTVTELEPPLWRMAKRKEETETASAEFVAMARVLEQHMQGREFLVGERATVGDFVLGYILDWANEVKLLAEFPVLKAYMERLYARPAAPLRIAEAFAMLRGA